MRRRWKILIGLLVVLAVLLAINAIIVDNETKGASVTIDGGQILSLPGGDVQVYEQGPDTPVDHTAPIVLLHCYSCSLHWWDRMAPLLANHHRVIRIDLLGHGGSAKPATGYSIEDQADLVAGALNRLNVEGAIVVGHSLGGAVAVAVASQASQLVDRVVIIDQAPDNSDTYSKGLGPLAWLGYVPVIGQAVYRLSHAPGSSGIVKSGYGRAFAPGFDVSGGFDNPDQVVDDLRAMTYTSFDESPSAEDDYVSEKPLTERMREAAVPLMVLFGDEDQIYNSDAAIAAYRATVPGVVTQLVAGAGHSPNVEKPEQTARTVLEFAEGAGIASPAPGAPGASPPTRPPKRQTQRPGGREQQRSGQQASRSQG